MLSLSSRPSKYDCALFGVFLISVVLIFASLSGAALWDDEAQVGIIARNLLNTGRMTGWDGRNLYGYNNGNLLDAKLNYINPPLDVVLAAASMKVLGPTTLAVRLPFALCAAGCLVAFVCLLRRLFPTNRPLVLYAYSFFALGVSFLLVARTGRYYSVSMLCQVLLVLFFYRYLERRRMLDAIAIAATVIAAFFASYLMAVGSIISVAALCICCHRREFRRSDLAAVSVAISLAAAATVPWAILHKIWYRPDIRGAVAGNIVTDKLTVLWYCVRDFNITGSLPWMLVVLLVALLFKYKQPKDNAVRASIRDWIVVTTGYVFAIGLFTYRPHSSPDVADTRYLSAIFPFTCAIGGIAVGLLHHYSKRAAIVVAALALTSTVLAWTPFEDTFPCTESVRSTLPSLVYEETHPYPTSNSLASDFIDRYTEQDDLVMAQPFFFANSLIFYSGTKVRLAGQLNHHSKVALNDSIGLGSSNFIEDTFPNWVVSFGRSREVEWLLPILERPHPEPGTGRVVRRYSLAAVLDVNCAQSQRPELYYHSFGPDPSFNRETDSVFVYKASAPIRAGTQ